MDLLGRVKVRIEAFGDMPSDEWLKETIQAISDRVCLRVSTESLPVLAESIVVDACVKAVNRRFDEGIVSESEGQGGSMSLSFVDDILSEYSSELSSLANMLSGDSSGSSPRVRGTFAYGRNLFASLRIIPACAGNIQRAFDLRVPFRDHPRVCGEH